MPLHDQVASVCALARNVRGGLDMAQVNTSINTATLDLLLETLIDLGAPPQNSRFAETQAKTVAGSLAALTGVANARS
jgi:hypothetical protein